MANTGEKGWRTLEQYDTATGTATGVTKPNIDTDPDYVAPVEDLSMCPVPVVSLSWRGITLYCVTDNGENTGFQGYVTLEEYNTENGVATGTTKANGSGDPDYIADFYNEAACPLPIIANRFAISLSRSTLNSGDACARADIMEFARFYLDVDDFPSASVLYATNFDNSLATTGHYGDGSITRYWDGTAFIGSFTFCE